MVIKQKNRFMELEGLRGVAAIVVAIYHNLLAFYVIAFLGTGSGTQNMRFEDNFYGSPVAALLSGTFAVAIFFVLSGFVLSIGFIQTKRVDILKNLAIKRYLRLMLPALASVILCFFLIVLGLSFTAEAGSITNSSWLLAQWGFNATLLDAIQNGTLGIFIQGGSLYNNVLWTMALEFLGSFLLFATLILFGESRYRWVVYASLFVLTFNTWFLAFVVGLVLAELYAASYIKRKTRSLFAVSAVIVVSLVLGGFPVGSTAGTFYGFIEILPFTSVNYVILFLTLGAGLLVYAVLWSAQVASLLAHKFLSNIGKYTFSLYLVHIPILYSFTAWLFVRFHSIGYDKAVILSMVCSIPVVVGVTYLFEKYIDSKSVTFANYFADIFYGKRKIDWTPYVFKCKARISANVNMVRTILLRPSSSRVEGEVE